MHHVWNTALHWSLAACRGCVLVNQQSLDNMQVHQEAVVTMAAAYRKVAVSAVAQMLGLVPQGAGRALLGILKTLADKWVITDWEGGGQCGMLDSVCDNHLVLCTILKGHPAACGSEIKPQLI